MNNPYQTPKVTQKIDEKNIKGGFFSDGSAVPLDCRGAWISIDKRYLRFKYLPAKSRNMVLIIFCVAVVLLIPFAALGGLGAIILYAIIHSVILVKNISKVEFSLDDEILLVDEKRRIIGIRKIQNGKPVFLGSKVPQAMLVRILDEIPCLDADLSKGSRLKYQAIAVSVWLAGMTAGVVVAQKLG